MNQPVGNTIREKREAIVRAAARPGLGDPLPAGDREAARGVSRSLQGSAPEIPWREIVALRDILVHEYFGINLQQVWTMT